MFDHLKKILQPETDSDEKENHSTEKKGNYKLQVATAAMLIEMAKSDGNYSQEEYSQIISILKKQFNLDENIINDLIQLSEQELDESTGLYRFSGVLNENLSNDEKFELMKNLWRLVYSDKKLDKYEDRLIKLIGGMLMMDHQQIINAKLLIRAEMNIE